MPSKSLKIRRALLSVSDKAGVVELGRALADAGAELVATGKTAQVLQDAGLTIIPIEQISGSPEAFNGRMKTLSFSVCGGILYRRGDAADEADLKKLKILPIDCVVVNFYPFEKTAEKARSQGLPKKDLIEQIDVGGPTLVRAAAKNTPDVIVLTDPAQYAAVIGELKANGQVSADTAEALAQAAWQRVSDYDLAISTELASDNLKLRYGENPHQSAHLETHADSPIDWAHPLTPTELSYNNILDVAAAYGLLSDLVELAPDRASVVIVKHNNPCGVATASTLKLALLRAWEGDPVSAFGGVVLLSRPLDAESASFLSERFVELIAAPGLDQGAGKKALDDVLAKRKKLKAVAVRAWGKAPRESRVAVPGGTLVQQTDLGLEGEVFKSVTKVAFPVEREGLARFGIAVNRALKSNAVALVREVPGEVGSFQLIGAGQGQPNRVEALEKLAIPRAQAVLRETGGRLEDCILVSDAFFPFRDGVDAAHAARIKQVIQPGGSIKDTEVIAACDEHGMAMVFTGRRHFRH